MAGRKRTEEELAERQVLAQDFKEFRETYLFTQKKLADVLGNGACRRSIQMIEAAKVTPSPETVNRFRQLAAKHKAGKNR